MTAETLFDEYHHFITKTNEILIPKKVHISINYISKESLLKINKDTKVAKEMCLYFLSFLVKTMLFEEYESGIHLKAEYLRKILSWHNMTDNKYIDIINALEIGTPDKGAFIEVNKSYKPGDYSRKYNLTDTYKVGTQKYQIKTTIVQNMLYRSVIEQMIKMETNPIAINSLKMYTMIDLPTTEQLMDRAKELIKEGYITKKGKKLTIQHRQKKTHWKDYKNRSFVEADIAIFEYLTSNGFIIPVCGKSNCPRVYDSLSLLPGWIRNEVKINGKKLVELDYKCLHPNLVMTIYNGQSKFLTHQLIAEQTNTDINKVKKNHLSFFNVEVNHLSRYNVFNYYTQNEPLVMEKLIKDKELHGYEYTSNLLFNLEVKLMTDVISILNEKGIYVMYVYDALYVQSAHIEEVSKVMNECASKLNIYTKVN